MFPEATNTLGGSNRYERIQKARLLRDQIGEQLEMEDRKRVLIGFQSQSIIADACPKCGSASYVDHPAHRGRSIRRDCGRCNHTIGFPVWNPGGQ